MAKKQMKFKPTPAGILFLSAIGILLIAIIVLIVYGATHCGSCKPADEEDGGRNNPPYSETDPNETPDPDAEVDPNKSPDPNASPDPNETPDPNNTPDPNETPDPNTTPGALTTPNPLDPPIVVNTPGQQSSASPGTSPSASPSPTYYTSPTSTMKKNAQKGYVSKDKVRMRKGPGTNFDVVKSDIAKNTAVTLYVEQNGWWFLKCGDKYGYIRKDLVTKGSAPTTPAPASPTHTSSEATGKVIASKIALRKDTSETSDCIHEYKTGEQVVIYYYVKDSSGRKWYYVKTSDGSKGYMFAEYVKVTSGKVNSK